MRIRMRAIPPWGLSALMLGAVLAAGCSAQVKGGEQGGTGATPSPGTGGAGTGLGGSVGPGTGGTGIGAGGAGPCTALAEVPRRLWRLSSAQFANATRDLLTLNATPTLMPSTSDGSSPYAFINGAYLTVEASYLTSSLFPTAENILNQIGTRISGTCTGGPCLVTCGAGQTQTACATQFARDFAPKVFRRPVADAEITDLMKVYNSVCPATSTSCTDFNTGIGLMIEALILSPSFIYRSELGDPGLVADATGKYPDTTLTSYEVATQLGFLFLNSTPDAPLLAAAANGTGLTTPAAIMAQVTRLLALPTTRSSITTVVANWFEMAQLQDKANKTVSLAPLATADQVQTAIVGELYSSAQQFVNDVLWTTGGKVTDLLTSPKVFVNTRLATLYGLPTAGTTATTFVGATWPASQMRAGILTQPAFLWAISDPALNSIVHRGKFIHDDVLCQDFFGNPIDLSTPSALAVINTGDSEVTHSDARMNPTAVCSGCHAQMDPYARVLQNFGPIGNYRTADEVGRPIDASYPFTRGPLAGMTITGPTGMAQGLIATKAFAGCAVQKMATYATGVPIPTYNTCELNDLRTQLDQSNGTISSLLTQLALSNFVRARAGGTAQ